MGYLPRFRRRLACLAGISSCLLPLTVSAQTPDIHEGHRHQVAVAPPTTPASTPTLSLADCLRIAHERQPALQAYRESLAAAESGSQGLQNMRFAGLFKREMPIRKEQACLGITAAAARLEQAERETNYAVTRTYFAIIFAREQKNVANKVVTELNDALENAKRLVKGGAKKPTQNDVERTEVYLRLAELKMEEADTGSTRAMAGLREAMGVGPNYDFVVAGDRLPEPTVTVNKEEAISQTLSRRPELTQANISAQVAALEVDAQGKNRKKQVRTFSSGAGPERSPIGKRAQKISAPAPPRLWIRPGAWSRWKRRMPISNGSKTLGMPPEGGRPPIRGISSPSASAKILRPWGKRSITRKSWRPWCWRPRLVLNTTRPSSK